MRLTEMQSTLISLLGDDKLSTKEIADRLEVPTRIAYDRLYKLYERGVLKRKRRQVVIRSKFRPPRKNIISYWELKRTL